VGGLAFLSAPDRIEENVKGQISFLFPLSLQRFPPDGFVDRVHKGRRRDEEDDLPSSHLHFSVSILSLPTSSKRD